ncbi:MAG TPA: saccharopine dehydrogenase NADP-binding domain-containing protein [Chitinophagaceae bacterium]|nr:saccharopine dehydrogenase NADP-binding domain-containing protein [Chitinophagaceae bacterium]
MQNSFLLYGANGYTGELIARHAAQYDLHPILAGRREEVLKPLATKLNYPYKVFDVVDSNTLLSALREVKLVVNAAGPFQFTAKPIIDACLQTGTHYLDVNGDIAVFEMIRQMDADAKGAGIMLLPGSGFDVVPTDCTALLLKKLLPDAITLKLAFATIGGGLSHGTATTMVNKLGQGGAVRRDGKIVSVPLGQKGIWIDFSNVSNNNIERKFVMTIPWGDIATAYFTTGIPDIESYTAISPGVYRLLKIQILFNWLLRTKFMRSIIRKKIDKRPAGPNDEQRSKAMSLVWGQAANGQGETKTVRMSCPDGYTLTMYSTLLLAQKVLQGNLKPGYQTPATAYGEDFVLELPNVKREILK